MERERSGPRLLTAYRLNFPVVHGSGGHFPLSTFEIVPKDPVNFVIEFVVVRLPTAHIASSAMCQ